MPKTKGPALPPGEREREELRELITEAHKAANELKAATSAAHAAVKLFETEYEPSLEKRYSGMLADLNRDMRQISEKWSLEFETRFKEFYDRVLGDDHEMPPSIKIGMVAIVVGVCTKLIETQARTIADRIVKLCEQRGQMFGEEYRKHISVLASDISKIVSAQMVLFDEPLINTEVLHMLYPDFRVPYEEVAERRAQLVQDLRGLAHRERTREPAKSGAAYEDITLFEGDIRL